MYFKEFPEFLYDFKYGKETKTSIVKDITRNIRFRKEVLENITLYDYVDVVDGDTPEIVAEKIYGNPEYHWIIMLANQRYDYISDWIMDEPTFDRYMNDKYGDQRYAIHHWEAKEVAHDMDDDWHVVNSDYPGAVSVSNDEWERRKNEEKRRIKIISPDLVSSILKQYKELL